MQSGPPQQLLQFALQSSDIILTVANIESLLTGLGAVVQKGLIRISCFAPLCSAMVPLALLFGTLSRLGAEHQSQAPLTFQLIHFQLR